MDKKNLFFGVLFLLGSFAVMIYQSKTLQEQAEAERALQEQAEQAAAENAAGAGANEPATVGEPVSEQAVTTEESVVNTVKNVSAEGEEEVKSVFSQVTEPVQETAIPKAAAPDAPEEKYVLSNEYIRVTFTNYGGAIRKIEFIHRDADEKYDYPKALDVDEPYSFNVDSTLPVLAIDLALGDQEPEEYAPAFSLISKSATAISFVHDGPDGGRIIREYALEPSDGEGEPFVIQHKTRFVNKGANAVGLQFYVNLGAVPPTAGDIYGGNQNFGYFANEDAEFIDASKLVGSRGGFLGMGSSTPTWKYSEKVADIQWASVKNQFFTGVLTPNDDQLASGFFIDTVKMDTFNDQGEPEYALRGRLRFDLAVLPAGQEKEIGMSYYVGPKEYLRLQGLGKEQDRVMQLAPDFFFIRHFAVISKLLLALMLGINSFIPNWGLTIILLTICIKGAMWPLTAVQVRSAKRMAKIQKPLQEIREKYKDNPTVMQKKTMELFKAHKVNPAAGCLPLFIQLPIFLSLFYTLRTASELRFAEFLWVNDLAVADTVSWLPNMPDWLPFFGGPIHILPFFMAITMVFQMRMTPTPTTDNLQRQMFQFMPIIFLLFCYRFPAGLVLYWTCQNLLTILQQWLTNRAKDDEVEIIPPASAESKKKSSSARKKSAKKRK